MIGLLIAAHLFGDFPLQNHWMQAKSRSSFVCTVHVAAYMTGFIALACLGILPVWALPLIAAQHWLQDRFALHTRWMKIYRQTPPDLWPVGPLCMDQAWHIAFLGLVSLCAGGAA
jgi:hypothetical protein